MSELIVIPSPLGGFDVLNCGVVIASFWDRDAALRYLDQYENGETHARYWWQADD
jgi:hypothetical protein